MTELIHIFNNIPRLEGSNNLVSPMIQLEGQLVEETWNDLSNNPKNVIRVIIQHCKGWTSAPHYPLVTMSDDQVVYQTLSSKRLHHQTGLTIVIATGISYGNLKFPEFNTNYISPNGLKNILDKYSGKMLMSNPNRKPTKALHEVEITLNALFDENPMSAIESLVTNKDLVWITGKS
jgi:hypothetical protein